MSWLELFDNDPNGAIKKLYLEYREEFINWAYQRYQVDVEEATEIFQLAVVVIYDNINQGKLTSLSSSIKTYLFAIGKNKVLEYKRRSQKVQTEDAIPALKDHILEEDDSKQIKETQLTLIAEMMVVLGDPCKRLLELYYYHQKSMKEITSILEYKNIDSTKNQKYKCTKRLLKLVDDHKEQQID